MMSGLDGLQRLGPQAMQPLTRGVDVGRTNVLAVRAAATQSGALDRLFELGLSRSVAALSPFASLQQQREASMQGAIDASMGSLEVPAATTNRNRDNATASMVAMVFGTLTGMVGSFYEAQSLQNRLKSEALDYEHASKMSGIAARQAEQDANSIMEASRDDIAWTTAEYGQAKAQTKARQGGSGFVAGQGSGAEVLASMEMAKQIDMMTINKNAVRAASQRRLQGTTERNRGTLADASAANLRGAAGAIKPGLSALSAGLEGGASMLGRYSRLRSGRFS